MTSLTVATDAEGAAGAAAEVLARMIEAARATRGIAHVALAGGSTPRRAYELLAARIETWRGVELWFADERAVPPDDPQSNYAMVAESLLARAAVPPGAVHRVPGERSPAEAAALYEAELRDALPPGEDGLPMLDAALLGLGVDGHTASLFPGRPETAGTGAVCLAVEDAPKPPSGRVSMTLEALGAARRVVFLATGAAKRPAVEAVLAGPDPSVPASLLGGPRCELVVDAAAAPEGDVEEPAHAPAVHHVALETPAADAGACRSFYALLGFRELRVPGGLRGRAVWLARSGQQVHLLLTDDPVVPALGHFAVVLEDYDAAMDDLVRAGHGPPEPRTEHWGSPRAYVRDPAGHLVELIASPPGG